MDFWLVAAVAGAGYLSKYWQSISQDNNVSQLSSGDPNYYKLESPGCPLRGLTNRPKRRRNNVARNRTISSATQLDIISLEDGTGAEVDSTGFNLGARQDLRALSVSNLQSGFSGNEDLEGLESRNILSGYGSEYFCGMSSNLPVEEFDRDNGRIRNRSSLRTKQSHVCSAKPMNSLESCLMAQLYKEHDSMEECVLSSLPSPATATARPLFVTDGSRIISKSFRNFISAQVEIDEHKFCEEACLANDKNVYGVPSLPKIGSMNYLTKAKAKVEERQKGKVINGKDFYPLDGSPEGTLLLCLGISIGIMASFMTNKREVDNLKNLLKQRENLVQDLQEELEMKDSMTVKELANENYESQDTRDNSVSKRASDIVHDGPNIDNSTRHGGKDYTQKAKESSESISKIEAELEAELERLGLNMNASSLEGKSLDVDELDPEFAVDFSQGELRVDMLGVEDVSKSKSNKDGASTSTTRDTGNYAVSPRELSLRLHEVIQSRLEECVNELEIALQNSQRKIQIMESGCKNWGELSNSQPRYMLNQESPITKEHKAVARPLFMNLSGDALDAYNEAHEELMKVSDSEEEDSPQRIYEDIQCTQHGLFQSLDDGLFGSVQDPEIPEEKSVGELLPSSVKMQAEHISLVLGSNDTTNSRDEISDCDNEVERELIKQIVERTKKGSPVVINAQRLLFSMDISENF